MGREAAATVHWRGETADAKALLESTEIVVRGPVRVRIARSDITAVRVDGVVLTVAIGTEQLVLHFSIGEAEKWRAALLKPPPTLADKLGIHADRPARVIGTVDDPTLAAALYNATTYDIDAAALFISVLRSRADIDATVETAQQRPSLPVWCVSGKGKHAAVSDTDVRTGMRSVGYIDTKTSEVSDLWTATRYSRRT